MKQRLTFILLFGIMVVQAQPPADYYNNAYQKKGYALRVALFNIVKSHTAVSYSALWDAFPTTDRRPDNGKVWDIYSDDPDGGADYYYTFVSDQCGNYSGEGDCYNREHSVPQSWFGEAAPMKTDLFHLYPTDGFVNGKRGNLPFGKVGNASWTSSNGSKLGNCTSDGYTGTVFEPIDAYKGDLARSYFYMAVCYMDKNLGQETQSMFSGGTLKPWALNMLMQWHNDDPVSQKELDRNNAVYNIQHNRNPFIDFPELVDKIWGNDSVNAFNPNSITELTCAARWQVFPIPADEYLTIVPPAEISGNMDIQILNLAGQVVASWTITAEEGYTLYMPDMAAGAYILHIMGDNFVLNKKIIKK